MKNPILFIVLLVLLMFACKKENTQTEPVIIRASGSIQDDIDAFRAMLGPLNTTPGATGGRREINWDAVPAEMLDQTLPNDFFNPTQAGAPAGRQRGLAYGSSTGSFRVSGSNFAPVNMQAASSFAPFSGANTFANVSANAWEMKFQVPGQNIDAVVKGFGAVFSDVDLDNSTSLEFFNGTTSLGQFFVPPHDATTSFSFLGVYFPDARVTSINVTHQGTLADGENDISSGGLDDLIVLDDFLYSEPIK